MQHVSEDGVGYMVRGWSRIGETSGQTHCLNAKAQTLKIKDEIGIKVSALRTQRSERNITLGIGVGKNENGSVLVAGGTLQFRWVVVEDQI